MQCRNALGSNDWFLLPYDAMVKKGIEWVLNGNCSWQEIVLDQTKLLETVEFAANLPEIKHNG